MSGISTFETGSKFGLDYKLYFQKDGKTISAFHDIPLRAGDNFNMVVEVPRWSNAKMEISRPEKFNPIKQDVKKGKPRFVPNVFPYNGYIWNYGALPQTWEDPSHVDQHTKCNGDSDPIDACEIGSKIHPSGSIIQVKVLGCFAMIDEGETDWKVLVIDVNDPLADKVNDLDDIEQHFPGLLKATHDWFKIYKVPDGKPLNNFAFDGQPKGRDFALKIIEETAQCWQKLMSGEVKCDEICVANSTLDNKCCSDDCGSDKFTAPTTPTAIPEEKTKWHFVSR